MKRCSIFFLALVLTSSITFARGREPNAEVTPQIQDAIHAGLEYLASQQLPSGGWIGDVGAKLRQGYRLMEGDAPHVGVTALAGMSFLAGGHLPGRGPYGEVVSRAIAFLLDHTNEFGFIGAFGTRMYSHAFATLFLAEVYGMSPRKELEPKLQKAIDLIVRCQNEDGAWRYSPFSYQSDMSVTVCQLMAMRAARNAGIQVPVSTIDDAVDYVRESLVQSDEDAWFRRDPVGYYRSAVGAFQYQVWGDHRSSFALTAAGITSLYHAAHYDTQALRPSLDFLEHTQRLLTQRWIGHYFYYYGHYYAVQAMFITGDTLESPYWSRYWEKTSVELVENQEEDGRWKNSIGPGDAFGTAVACMVLQVPYRYLPILQR